MTNTNNEWIMNARSIYRVWPHMYNEFKKAIEDNLPQSISREKVNGFKGELHFERIGSSCCGAKVDDPGNTGEWVCSSCKEHCDEDYIQDVDVAVLNFAGKPEVQIFRIEYESASDEYEDIEWCVHQFLLEKFGGTSNLEFMRSEVNPIKVLDHRD